MKKVLIIGFVLILILSLFFVSANNRQNIQVVTNQQVTVPANDLIKLDVGGNYGWNLKNVKANSEGDYRVYASFESNGQKIESNWEFKVVSVPPTVALPVE